MRQLQAHNKNVKMPSLFCKLAVDDNHPQMKSIITEMTHFDSDQRLSIEHTNEKTKLSNSEYSIKLGSIYLQCSIEKY